MDGSTSSTCLNITLSETATGRWTAIAKSNALDNPRPLASSYKKTFIVFRAKNSSRLSLSTKSWVILSLIPGLVTNALHRAAIALALLPLSSPKSAGGIINLIVASSNSCWTSWTIFSNPFLGVPKPKLPMTGFEGSGKLFWYEGISLPVLYTNGLRSNRVGSGPT